MLKELMYAGKSYVRNMDMEDIAALKLCLVSFGVLAGIAVPRRARQAAACLAGIALVGTAVPLVSSFAASLLHPREG